MQKLIITVKGGLVTSIISNSKNIDVTILDYDNETLVSEYQSPDSIMTDEGISEYIKREESNYEFSGDITVAGFNAEDVINNALDDDIELSHEDAEAILHLMQKNQDANEGVNWEFISQMTETYLESKL